jgi:restriction system protein
MAEEPTEPGSRRCEQEAEELLLDYEDFLRHRRLPQWSPDSPEALAVRRVPQQPRKDSSDLTDLSDQERCALYAP